MRWFSYSTLFSRKPFLKNFEVRYKKHQIAIDYKVGVAGGERLNGVGLVNILF